MDIDYVEFEVSNMAETKAFYGNLFSWTYTDYGPDYAEFRGEKTVGGFHAVEKPCVGGPLIIFRTDDLHGCMRKCANPGQKFPGIFSNFRVACVSSLKIPVAIVWLSGPTNKPGTPIMNNNVDTDGRHDFDFLHGRWNITNRRLKERLTGCQDWIEFPAEMETRPILRGLGNYDIMRTAFDSKPFEGLSLRLFSPATKQWSIYWADSSSGVLQPAVEGRFNNGTGVFFCNDQHSGRPVRCRFTWSEITGKGARWEQAFSVDQEQSWETNWVMLFSRGG